MNFFVSCRRTYVLKNNISQQSDIYIYISLEQENIISSWGYQICKHILQSLAKKYCLLQSFLRHFYGIIVLLCLGGSVLVSQSLYNISYHPFLSQFKCFNKQKDIIEYQLSRIFYPYTKMLSYPHSIYDTRILTKEILH